MTDTSTRFDRVPPIESEGETPSREAILEWWSTEFDVDRINFERLSFWERGRGKIWCTSAAVPDPVRIEALGMFCLRTRGADWKPTTNAAQRFGQHADRRVIDVNREVAAAFVAGEDRSVAWDGPRGYVFVRTGVGGRQTVLGVGQYLDGELVSAVPKPRRRALLGSGQDV